MATVVLGTDSAIYQGAAGVTDEDSMTEIGGLISGSLSISVDAVDTTNNDDAGFTSALYGNATATLSLEARFDPGDTALEAIMNAGATAKTILSFGIAPEGSATDNDFWAFDGLVTSVEINAGTNNEPVNISFEIQSTSTITHGVTTS